MKENEVNEEKLKEQWFLCRDCHNVFSHVYPSDGEIEEFSPKKASDKSCIRCDKCNGIKLAEVSNILSANLTNSKDFLCFWDLKPCNEHHCLVDTVTVSNDIETTVRIICNRCKSKLRWKI